MWTLKHKLGGLLGWFAPTTDNPDIGNGLAALLHRFRGADDRFDNTDPIEPSDELARPETATDGSKSPDAETQPPLNQPNDESDEASGGSDEEAGDTYTYRGADRSRDRGDERTDPQEPARSETTRSFFGRRAE